MKHLIRYDSRFYPNGSKTKLYLSTIRQLNNAVDILRVEFEALPSGYVPYLNVQRYAKDKSYIDSTPQYVAFNEVDGGYEKVLTEWFTEIAGHIDISVTLIGAEIEVEGELTNKRIECGMFYISIDGSVISQGDSLPPPPPVSEIEYKVDKDLTGYDPLTEIAPVLAFAYVDNGGRAEKIKLDNGEVLTELELMTKGYTKSLLDLKAEKSSAALSIKGNDTSSVGDVKDLTVANVIDLLSPNGTMTINHNLRVMKDLFVDGEGYETKLQELKIEKNTLLLRDGALTGLGVGEYAGFIFHLYDGTNNGFFGVDKDGYAKVGDVGDLQTLATRQDTPVANGLAYWNDTLKRLDTDADLTFNTALNRLVSAQFAGQIIYLSNGIIQEGGSANAYINLPSTGTVISRNIADTNPALKVQISHTDSTGNITEFWSNVGGTTARRGYINKNGDYITNGRFISSNGIASGSGIANASLTLPSTGALIQRNIADANPALIINEQQGTGNIANFQFGGANKLEVTKDGWLFQNGTRLLHTFSHPTGSSAIPTGRNVFLGQEAGNLTMGSTATSTEHASYNNAFGYKTLFSNTTGSNNAANGYAALYSNTTGSNNTASGFGAGRYFGSGTDELTIINNSIFIGANSRANANNETNEIVIGYETLGKGSNTVTLGNSSITDYYFNANTNATSRFGNIRFGSITNGAIGDIPATINAITGQTANLLNLQVNGTTKSYFDKDGILNGDVAYSNTISGLTATTIKGAIDELAGLVDGIETLLAAL